MKKLLLAFMVLFAVSAFSTGCGIKGKLDLPDEEEGEIYNK